MYFDDDITEELHELFISNEEINDRNSNQTLSEFLLEQSCKKANRLGKEKKKIKEVSFSKENDGYHIIFRCEDNL